MVSSCELRFDKISITEQKAYVPDEFIYLFQETDRREVAISEEDGGGFDVGYRADRSVILERLDLAGYTAEGAPKGDSKKSGPPLLHRRLFA
jgi:hypothetical protein